LVSAPTREAQNPTAAETPRLITPTFTLAWLVNFLQYLTFYVLVTTMALYAVRQFAASDAASGLASSSFVVGATVARLFTGYLVDRLGKRRVLLVSLVLVVIACALYLTAGSLSLLIAVRTVHGFAYAFVSTAAMALAQSAIPAARRAEGTGFLALGTTLATAVGPALGLFLVGSFDYDVLFRVAVGTSVAGLVLGLFLQEPPVPAPAAGVGTGEGSGEGAATAGRFSLRNILHPAVVPIGIFMLLVGLCYAGVITYLNAYAEERDVVAGASLFFLAYAVAMFAMRFVLGKVQDRRGDNVVVYFGLVFLTVALVVLALATEDWHVVLAGACTGLGYGTLMPAAQAIAVGAVPVHRVGTGISTLLLLADLGIGLGPVVLGVVVSAAGYGTMFLVLAVLAIVAAVFYQVTHGRRERARRGAAAGA
jgi:MFS family permease